MTREEIINEIKSILEELNYPDAVSYLTQNDRGWLEANIRALEQEPCEDAISRQAAIDCLTATKLKKFDFILQARAELKNLPPVTLRSLNPEADREKSKAYCAECDHIEMCSWYPHDGCEWLKTDRYNAGYNAAKREIALSGEYERAYERGKADAQPKTGHWIDKDEKSAVCSCCNRNNTLYGDFCKWCGAKMVELQESEG